MGDLGLLRPPQHIRFGIGAARTAGTIAAALGTRVLVCTDSYLAGAEQGRIVRVSLRDASVEALVLDAALPELPLPSVEEAVELARAYEPDVVVGLGGGSCIDLAKLVSLAVSSDEPLQAYYGESEVPRTLLPVVAIPTTAGTGSEVTPVAVLSDPNRELKVGVSSPHLVPRVAICDPELTAGAPAHVTAYAGIDALAHAIEAYTAISRPTWVDAGERVFIGANVLSDGFALEAIALLSNSLRGAMNDEPADRAKALEGSLRAGLAFATAGTAAAHALQYPVGAATSTPHGLGVGILLPAVMAFNAPVREQRFAEVARAMAVGDDALAAIEGTRALADDLGLPPSLEALGVSDSDLSTIADKALGITRLIGNNPREVDFDGALRILRAAHAGKPESLLDEKEKA